MSTNVWALLVWVTLLIEITAFIIAVITGNWVVAIIAVALVVQWIADRAE